MSRVLHHPAAALGAAGWALAAVVLSTGVGVLAAEDSKILVAIALGAGAAVAIALRPWPAFLAILAARATFADTVIADLLTLVGGGAALLLAGRRAPAARVTIPLLAFLLVALPSLPLAPSPDEGQTPEHLVTPIGKIAYAGYPSAELLEWVRLGAALVVFGLGAWAVTTRARLETTVAAILASSVVPIGMALEQLVTGRTVSRPRDPGASDFPAVEGAFIHPNHLALYLLVILVIAVVVLLETRRSDVRIAVGALLAAGTVCFFLTYTRSAWIGFAVALLLLSLMRYRRLIPIGAVALVVALVVFPGAAGRAQTRFGDLTSSSQASSSNSWSWRTGQWERMIPQGTERPLFGNGLGSYSRLTVEEFGHGSSDYPVVAKDAGPGGAEGFNAHNDFVKSWVELGAVGLLLWCLVLAGLLATALRARRAPPAADYATALAAIMVALIGISFADAVQSYPALLIYVAGLAGAVVGVAARARPE